jgi:hypothetical protein
VSKLDAAVQDAAVERLVMLSDDRRHGVAQKCRAAGHRSSRSTLPTIPSRASSNARRAHATVAAKAGNE